MRKNSIIREMNTREILDKYLSKALGVELKDGRLKQIDEAKYVLTLDYTLKMQNIHERYRCGVPVIIEGETGVGKSALVQMLSALWNHSLLDSWNTEKGRIHDLLSKRIGNLSDASCKSREVSVFVACGTLSVYPNKFYCKKKCVQLVEQLSEGKYISCEDMQVLCTLPDSTQLNTHLREHLLAMRHLPVVSLLVTREKADLLTLFEEAAKTDTVQVSTYL